MQLVQLVVDTTGLYEVYGTVLGILALHWVIRKTVRTLNKS
jgi:hypothetical protein